MPKFKIGDEVKVNSPGNVFHNKIATVTKFRGGNDYSIMLKDGGGSIGASERYLVLLKAKKRYKDWEYA